MSCQETCAARYTRAYVRLMFHNLTMKKTKVGRQSLEWGDHKCQVKTEPTCHLRSHL